LSGNVRHARHNGNNALYEALEVVQNENIYFGWWPHREEEYKVWRQNERNRLRARLANEEKDLRRLRVEKRRREGNNSNRNRMSGF
ncbi:34534_t:CDS:2, partial [Racocetra persica]